MFAVPRSWSGGSKQHCFPVGRNLRSPVQIFTRERHNLWRAPCPVAITRNANPSVPRKGRVRYELREIDLSPVRRESHAGLIIHGGNDSLGENARRRRRFRHSIWRRGSIVASRPRCATYREGDGERIGGWQDPTRSSPESAHGHLPVRLIDISRLITAGRIDSQSG